MNAVSGEIPVTAKIRTGTRDDKPTAINLVRRLVAESPAAAITIHGRSRAQRYTKLADWDYISKVAAAVKKQVRSVKMPRVMAVTQFHGSLVMVTYFHGRIGMQASIKALIALWLREEL